MWEGSRWHLLQRLWCELDVLLAGSALFPVFLDPRFEAFACGRIAIAKFEGGDVGVGNRELFAGVAGNNANERIGESLACFAIEDVAFEFAAVFAGDGYVAAVVKGFLQSLTNVFVAC